MLHKSKDLLGKEDSDRRGFLRGVIGTLASLIGVTTAGSVGTYLLSGSGVSQPERWADAGEIADFRQGAPQEVQFENRELDGWSVTADKASAWIVRKGDGSITAFSPQCTHLGCAYHWERKKGDPENGQFVCPCHGSHFDSTGNVIAGPAPRPLDRYRTKIEGSRLWILPSDSKKRT
jgi:menaquinol-cytochrome c reductase iron-sulfur subunit